MMDTRTDYQKRTAERHDRVVDDYRRVMPDAKSPNRAMVVVASLHGMTRDGVRKILIERGVYTPRPKND